MEKLKNKLSEGKKRNSKRSFAEKALQSEIPSKYDEADYEWLKCNTDPRKTASVFALQEQMVESRAWKKIRGLIEDDNCRLCGEHRKKFSTFCQDVKYCQDQNMSNATTIHSKFLAVKWAMEMGIMPDGTKWYSEKWEKEKCWKMKERDCIGKDENELYCEKAGSYTGG